MNDPNYVKFPAQGLFRPRGGVGGWLKRGMKEPLEVMEIPQFNVLTLNYGGDCRTVYIY